MAGENSRKHKATIMIVDDEKMVTTTLATYLSLETDYEILTFQSPKAALEVLQRQQVDLVISDFLMPEMDGLRFLSQVQAIYPDIAGILLTGYADKESAIKAINEINLYHYVEKPWDNEHFRIIIRNALRSKQLQSVLQYKINELNGVLLEREKLRQINAEMKEELQLAKDVQESMLPESFPHAHNLNIAAIYKPVLEVGGDFYDVISLTDKKMAILLADVTGHGIQAALLTGLLKSSFLAMQGSDARPGTIMRRLNKLLHHVLPQNIYVAALIVVLDPENGSGCLANGGIPHTFITRETQPRVERIAANGLVLGVTADDLFQPGDEVTFQLNTGDKLILYTDGLTEVAGNGNDYFERHLVKNLERCISKPVRATTAELYAAAKKFSLPDHCWDDVTILGIEVI